MSQNMGPCPGTQSSIQFVFQHHPDVVLAMLASCPSQCLGTVQGLAQAKDCFQWQFGCSLPVLGEECGGEPTRQFNCMEVSDDMAAGLGAAQQLLVHCIC